MLRRSLIGAPLALLAAPPKLPPLTQKVRAFGYDWSVFDASDWQVEGSGASQVLHLKVARPQEANPRAPMQYALAEEAGLARFTLEVEMKPDVGKNNKAGSTILVYAWRDNLHFNYVHLSSDTGREQPVHNGVFHVYGGDRVRISSEDGPRTFPNADWTPVRVDYDASKNLVETRVRGEKNPSLRGVDLSLGAGRIGLGSFFNTGSFRNFRLTRG
jgi:YD repeat-containing protein